MLTRTVVLAVTLASDGGSLGTTVDLFDRAVELCDQLNARARRGEPGIVSAKIIKGPGAVTRRRKPAKRPKTAKSPALRPSRTDIKMMGKKRAARMARLAPR